MRALILSQYCYPEQDLKCFPLAIALKTQGFQVEILTGYPSHPLGKLYDGYKMGLFDREYTEGITINRVPLFIDHTASAIKRSINYISFALSASVIGPFLIEKPDVIYVYHAPATIAIPAIFLKCLYGSKIFYDINDYWPDSITASGMLTNRALINIIGFFCKLSYRYFDNINVVSKGYREKLLKLGVPENRISLIYNWPLEIRSDRSDAFRAYKELFGTHFSVVYAGNIGKAQSLEVVIKAASMLKKQGVTEIKFIMVGKGVESAVLQAQIRDENLEELVIVTGAIPANNVGEFLEAADVLMLHLKGDPLFEITIPSKLGNYFSMGKPILCGVRGEAAEMVKESKSGLCFEPDNHADLYEKVITFRNLTDAERKEMGKNGKEFFENLISFPIGSQRIIGILEALSR